MTNEELKPCPFCGSAATVPDTQELQDITGDTFVFCNNYNCEFDEEVTIKAWNTRAEPQAVDVEALKKNPDDQQDKESASGRYTYSLGWNDCIDRLSANGYLSTASLQQDNAEALAALDEMKNSILAAMLAIEVEKADANTWNNLEKAAEGYETIRAALEGKND